MALTTDTSRTRKERLARPHPLDALTLIWIAGGCAFGLLLFWIL